MRNISLILFMLAMGIFTKTSAQAVILKSDTIEVSCSATDTFLMPVRLDNFTNVSGLQFTLHWDSTKLDYAYITALHPQFSGVGFDTTTLMVNSGNLTFAWTDLAGLSLPSNTVLFQVAFRRIGGSQAVLSFIDDPTEVIAFNNQFDEIPSETHSGLVIPLDDEAPAITCPANVTVQGPGATPVPNIAPLSATDNCGDPETGWSSGGATLVNFHNDDDASSSLFNIGTSTVTYRTTDVGGNTATCTFNVTVEFAVTTTDLTLVANNVSASCGEATSIDVLAYNFDSIAGLQFSLEWLTSALQYGSVSNLNPALDLNQSNFDQTQAAGGTLTFAWTSASITGVTVPDGTVLFTLNFDVLGAGTLTFSDNPTAILAFSGTVFPPEEVPVETIASIIAVLDTTAPVVTCPADVTVQWPGSSIVSDIAPLSLTDNCAAPTVGWTSSGATVGNHLNDSDASGDLFNLGTTTITYIATDAGGNTSTCSFNVTVEFANNTTDLTIIANSVTASCGSTVGVDISTLNFETIAGAQFTVNWNPAELQYTSISALNVPLGINITNFNETNVGTGSLTFAWTAADLNGLSVNNGSILFRLNFNLLGTNTSLISFGDDPTARLAFDGGSFDEIPMLTINGQVSVSDNAAPAITCPANVSVEAPQGQLTAAVQGLEPLALSDNCGGGSPTLTYVATGATNTSGTGAANGTYSAGTTTIVYTATDNNNNTATCSFQVVVDAGTPLTIRVDTVELGCQGTPDQITVNISMDDFTDIKFLHFWLNWDTTKLEFDTLFNQFPGLNLSNGMFFNFGDTSSGLLKFFGGNQSWPNIPTGGIFFSITFNVLDLTGLTGLTISGPVEAVNSNFENVAVITIDGVISNSVDNEPPVVTCPPNVTVDPPNNECQAIYEPPAPTATDACGQVTNISYEPATTSFGGGENIITYTVEDQAGNTATCSFVLTVTDSTAPAPVACPANITVNAASTACDAPATWTPPTFTDCSFITTVNNFFPGDLFPVGSCTPTVVTYVSTDFFGNSSTCSFSVLVLDVTPPTITCPPNMTLSPVNSCDTIVNYDPAIASDFCDQDLDIASDVPSGTSIPPGVTIVTWAALDDCSNLAECTFSITVVDAVAPVLSACPDDITVTSDANNCGANVSWTDPTATDDCDPLVAVTANAQPGSFFAVGDSTITYTATDDYGNTTTCSFTVTVQDLTPPTLSNCPTAPMIVILPPNGPNNIDCDTILTWTPPTAQDNCSDFTLVSNFNPGHNFTTGDTMVMYIVTDASGNADTCSFLVSVRDQEPPVLSNCPPNITVNGNGACTATADWVEPTASDNCSIPTITSPFEPGDEFSVGSTIVQIIAQDASLNYDTCTFTVTVLGVPPGFDLSSLPIDITVSACDTLLEWEYPTPVGFCNPAVVTSDPPSPTSFGPGEHIITFTATDNVATITATFVITVVDNTAPVFTTCPAEPVRVNTGGIVLSGEGFIADADTVTGCQAVELFFTLPLATDNCSPAPSVVQSAGSASGSVFTIGTHSVTFTATDANGNTALCSVTLEVVELDGVRPSADPNPACLNETVIISAENIQGATYVWTKAPSTVLQASGSQYTIPSLTSQTQGIYTVYANVNGCLTPVDSVNVILITAPNPQSDVFQIQAGTLDTFNVFLNDGLESPQDYEICATSPDPLPAGITLLNNGLFSYQEQSGKSVSFAYQICYCGEPGEMATVTITLANLPCTFIPNIITPNGDGLNDWFEIPCLDGGVNRENSITIYNQWGDLVFEDKGYTNDPNDPSHPAWRGTLKGKTGQDLPDGVYYYIFKPGPNEKAVKGFIEIFR